MKSIFGSVYFCFVDGFFSVSSVLCSSFGVEGGG